MAAPVTSSTGSPRRQVPGEDFYPRRELDPEIKWIIVWLIILAILGGVMCYLDMAELFLMSLLMGLFAAATI